MSSSIISVAVDTSVSMSDINFEGIVVLRLFHETSV